jgi:hypothetical protein
MLDLHLTKNRGSVVGDGDISVRRDHDLIGLTSRTQRGLDDVGH